ncbi:Engulfment and cell motility protein 1 [Myotis brandtii]|uniref:Engulfment and cell motility protein 1 n=1 Tax=Myotis brandtii TaxID=109478 RepID=S7MWD9_MYOBR|nr:Engulfment and cell motility protein 1 [Myotis brandtii]
MPPPADIVKVAIEWPGAYPKLMEIDQKKPLSAIIKEVCDGWSLSNHEFFALQHADSSNFYITEKDHTGLQFTSTLHKVESAQQRTARQCYQVAFSPSKSGDHLGLRVLC